MSRFLPALRARLAVALCAALWLPAFADDGHGHGEAPAAEAAASPRMSARSELFELVGVAEKGQLVIYLDRFATNEPVKGAKVEFEAGSEKGVAAERADGAYAAPIKALEGAEAVALSFTVTAGADVDLLAGELSMPAAHDDHAAEEPAWRHWIPYVAMALALLALAAFERKRRARRTEKQA